MSSVAVSVLGCGWLGLPVAQQLVESGCQVKGSTTTDKKMEVLRRAGIKPYWVHLIPDIDKDVGDFFSSQILFLNIPYRRDFLDPGFYKVQIESVIKHAERSSIEWIIFASSTSVYPDSLLKASEDALFVPVDARARVLLETEDLLRRHKRLGATILRFAGLYGGERKIGRFLAGRSSLEDGEKPVNLVHVDDCVNIVAQIVMKNLRGETFNVCSDAHPSRRVLYTAAAKKQGFTVPVFLPSQGQAGKVVPNAKLKQCLGYSFGHPDPLSDI